MNAHELKQLHVRRDKLAARAKAEQQEADAARSRHAATLGELRSLDQKIAATRTQPTVSEHALLRYAERVLGLDIKALTVAILTPETRAMIEAIGSGKVPTAGGLTLVVKNKTVVTVLGKEA